MKLSSNTWGRPLMLAFNKPPRAGPSSQSTFCGRSDPRKIRDFVT